jgi:hypothetical protein
VGCCGQAVDRRLTITQREIDEGLTLQLEYVGGRAVNVTGPVTGKSYTFSGIQRIGKVDPRDAPAILQDRRFRLKAIIRTKYSSEVS